MNKGFSSIGLYNPKTPENFGAVLRAAFCYNSSLVCYSGKRLGRSALDTPKAFKSLPVLHVEDLQKAVPYGAVPVAVDLIENATPLHKFYHPPQAFYIFGPEDGTLGKRITDFCKYTIYIPTRTCMNLAATVNVVLYDRLAKQEIMK